MKDISIIIVSWNVKDYLNKCLSSLETNVNQMPNRQIETVLIDNGSNDGTVPFVKASYPWVKIIENNHNPGFAFANNQGINQSSGRYILLLNPDTQLLENALVSLLEFMESTPRAGAAGSLLLNPDWSLQESSYPFPTLSRELWFLLHLDRIFNYALYPMQSWSQEQARPVDVVQGASLIVRRQIVEKIGLLDTNYFMYTEEVDWCRRIKNAGWEIYWVPSSQVIHYGGQSTRQVATSMFLQLYKSKLLYYRKFYSWPGPMVYKVILFFIALVRLLLTPLVIFFRAPVRQDYLTLAGRYARLIKALPGM